MGTRNLRVAGCDWGRARHLRFQRDRGHRARHVGLDAYFDASGCRLTLPSKIEKASERVFPA